MDNGAGDVWQALELIGHTMTEEHESEHSSMAHITAEAESKT